MAPDRLPNPQHAPPPATAALDWRDPKWVDGIHAGDERVFSTIVRALGPALCAYARRYVGSTADAEELVQSLFVDLWINRARFVARDAIRISIRAYLYRAVTNRAFNLARNRGTERRSLEHVARIAEEAAPANAELNDSERMVHRSQLAIAVRAAIEALPERVRTAFELVRLRGLTYPEAAHVMGVSAKTIDSHLTRAMHALRERLRGIWP